MATQKTSKKIRVSDDGDHTKLHQRLQVPDYSNPRVIVLASPSPLQSLSSFRNLGLGCERVRKRRRRGEEIRFSTSSGNAGISVRVVSPYFSGKMAADLGKATLRNEARDCRGDEKMKTSRKKREVDNSVQFKMGIFESDPKICNLEFGKKENKSDNTEKEENSRKHRKIEDVKVENSHIHRVFCPAFQEKAANGNDIIGDKQVEKGSKKIKEKKQRNSEKESNEQVCGKEKYEDGALPLEAKRVVSPYFAGRARKQKDRQKEIKDLTSTESVCNEQWDVANIDAPMADFNEVNASVEVKVKLDQCSDDQFKSVLSSCMNVKRKQVKLEHLSHLEVNNNVHVVKIQARNNDEMTKKQKKKKKKKKQKGIDMEIGSFLKGCVSFEDNDGDDDLCVMEDGVDNKMNVKECDYSKLEELLSTFAYKGRCNINGQRDSVNEVSGEDNANSSANNRGKKENNKRGTALSALEKLNEAYKRRASDNTWKPPRSPFNLLQEDHAHDPWRVMIICMLLNITTGLQVKKVLSKFFSLCPDAKSAIDVEALEIARVIQSLGLHRKRALMIQQFSREYLSDDWTHVTQLHGIGKYAADAYAIFCNGMWDQVTPNDHMLNYYWKYLRKRSLRSI